MITIQEFTVIFVGTPEERGLTVWNKQIADESAEDAKQRLKCYDMPFGNDWIYRYVFLI